MKKIKCKHCNNEWITESEKILVTCSSCGKKTPNYKKLPKSNDMIKSIKKELSGSDAQQP
jgi:predicted  nucleic acid-binding Zn-ribbon protein